MKSYYVYILASKKKGTLYIGITGNLVKRIFDHKEGALGSFTRQYSVKDLVYYEETADVAAAIAREKQLKNWHRQWKINLIEATNPSWGDLLAEFVDPETSSE